MPHRPSREVEAIVAGRHDDPFAFLGMHEASAGIYVRAILPDAEEMAVIDTATGDVAARGERIHPAGFFVASMPDRKAPFRYRLRVLRGGHWHEFDDVYRFPPVLGELDIHLLVEGNHLASYQKLGAHAVVHDGVEGVAFAVWAPNARRVSLVGDFNAWDGRRMPMRKRHAGGFWEIFVPGLRPGHLYKYELLGAHGELLPLKADPHAERAERPPGTASVVAGPSRHLWQDSGWMSGRWEHNNREAPISIYEVHLGSWRRNPGGPGRYLSYRELAEQLVPYVADLGFTHIEVMPMTEYPFDGSWGYQPISLFAPTSRHGGPDDCRAFIDSCHHAGLGLWLDWVPGHFPTDAHGLGRFDGTALYEHADPRQGLHRDWNTLIYNYGRREVTNFLLSKALYWLREFHIDGLRVDAVASMLYLDYARQPGEWVANRFGGRENIEAIDFLKRFNELAHREPGAITIAEESTAWPGVSRPVYTGGLGFTMKWNMGWMHDMFQYFAKDSVFRKYHQQLITFSMLYAFTENFVLPVSHDEVVYGKSSLIYKMPGDEWQRFANTRAFLAYMFAHPGKKLLFMGTEFGQTSEWNHDTQLEWRLLQYPIHYKLQTMVKELNWLYRNEPALYEVDDTYHGFEWIDLQDAESSIITFIRFARSREDFIVFACNFTPVPREGYRIGVPRGGLYRELFNTDSELFGGANLGNAGAVMAEEIPHHGRSASLVITLPPLAVVAFKP